jgi:hypothetical protein
MEAVPERPILKGKRKLAEASSSDESKKVKLMELALDSQLTTAPPPKPVASPSASAASKVTSAKKKKSLISLLLTSGEVNVGEGFGLFD